MKAKGIVTGVIRDAKTGKFKRTFTVENNLTDYFLGTMTTIPRSTSTAKLGPNIFVSASTAINNDRGQWVGRVAAVGVIESGVSSPVLVIPPSGTGSPVLDTPPYVQFQQRFAPPAADRTITIIGLTINGTNVTAERVIADAWVNLNPVCGQTTTETLDIFYRVQFLYEYDLTVPADQNVSKDIALRTKTAASFAAARSSSNQSYYFNKVTAAWEGGQNFNNRQIGFTYTTNVHDNTLPTAVNSTTTNSDLCKTNINADFSITDSVGKLVGTIQYGGSGATALSHDFRSVLDLDGTVDDPVQSIFGHSADATAPFYDSTKTQSGTGTLAVDGTTWINPDWPKMYRVDIIQGGATNTATYKLKIRNHFGFYLNSYREQERALNFMGPLTGDILYEGFDIDREDVAWRTYNHPTKKWLGMAVNPTEICIVDISKQTGIRIHSSIQPLFTPTKIGIVYHDETVDVLWVPCRETGLYKVEDPSGARIVTKIALPVGTGSPLGSGSPIPLLDRCLTVTKTHDGTNPNSRLWAIFSDPVGVYDDTNAIGLWFSDDDGNSWEQDFTWNPIPRIYWQAAQSINDMPYITGDLNHPDMRLMIMYNSGSDSLTYLNYVGMWHDSVNGTVNGPSLNNIGYYYKGRRALGPLVYYGEDPRSWGGQMVIASPQSTEWGGSFFYATQSWLGYFDYGFTTFRSLANLGMVTKWLTSTNVNTLGDDTLMFIDSNELGEYHRNGVFEKEIFQDHGTNFSNTSGSTQYAQLYLGKGIFFGATWAGNRDVGSIVRPDRYNENHITSVSTAYAPLGHSNPELNVWTDYFWDGVNWVEDLDGLGAAKPTNDAAEELFDGVTIEFTDSVLGSAGNWIATDYYTFGVADGIWLDSSTEIAHTTALYFKPASDGNTVIESNFLPAALKVVDTKEIIPLLTLLNTGLGTMIPNGNFSFYSNDGFNLDFFDSHFQSTEYIANPTASPSENPRTDVHAGMTFKFYSDTSTSSQKQFVLGFSSATRVANVGNYEPDGATPRENSPEFAFRFDPPTNGATYFVNVSVMHSGIEMAKIEDYPYRLNSQYMDWFRIEIKKDGHIVYSVRHPSTGEEVLYDSSVGSPSPPPIATFENYHIDWVSSGGATASYRELFIYGRATADNYLTLGDVGANSGYWNPDLFAIDYERGLSVQINSVEGTRVADNLTGDNYSGTITPLIAGEYSLFPKDGVIRYSAADNGAPIAVTYTEILND